MDAVRPLREEHYAAVRRICEICGIDHDLVTGRGQRSDVVLTRAMVFAYLHSRMSARWADLERAFGRPRRAIMCSVRTLKGLITYHKEIREQWTDLCEKMEGAG